MKRFRSITMKLITLNVAPYQLSLLDQLVKEGLYPNRSEAIRAAIKDLLDLHQKLERRRP